ncbi:hypothetical protein [Paenibacillus ihbetae]|uniref:Uncharacterized protein n=1 Tax=Paenibacillus ihbetae TaxID=1870820 RepID=A0A1B2E584_9BACL|nr:hypothetical protein [Paenibacillus ihbetae]ANY75130.1 hypothetical protein BBD41_22565 [Paenibacillus ihbetae]OOC62705.1 hypothetical protein BBD40_13075 [Paenibacillus ihbetae]
MISDERLDELRLSGDLVRVVRDDLESNDIIGFVVAWDPQHVIIRRRNRRVVKLDRNYSYQLKSEPRVSPIEP